MAAKKAKKKVQIFPIVNTIIMILFVIITLYPCLLYTSPSPRDTR